MNKPIVEFTCTGLSGSTTVRGDVLNWINHKRDIGAIKDGDVLAFADVDLVIREKDYYSYECEIHSKNGDIILSRPNWTNETLFDEYSSIEAFLYEEHAKSGCNYVVHCATTILYATFDKALGKMTLTYVNKDAQVEESAVETA
jgi:hypothetical protein